MNSLSSVKSDDAAWATVRTPLSKAQLVDFCQDIERLFRINPFIEFREWHRLDNNRYRVSGRNLSQEPPIEFEYELTATQFPNGVTVGYSSGIKSNTRFEIEAQDGGATLTIVDDYSGTPEAERQRRINEVDKSLIKWAADLQLFTLLWKRWSWFAPWRWYMHHVWQPLKPTGRRIVYMLLWISVVEFALIALGFTIYWIEYT